jgi:hypothetical protein
MLNKQSPPIKTECPSVLSKRWHVQKQIPEGKPSTTSQSNPYDILEKIVKKEAKSHNRKKKSPESDGLQQQKTPKATNSRYFNQSATNQLPQSP